MDFTLAVLRLRRNTHLSRDFCSPQDFEVLLTSDSGASKTKFLLECRTKRNEEITEAVLRFAKRALGPISKRAVPIPVYTSTVDVPCSSSFPSPPLVCLPITDECDVTKFDKNAEFYNLSLVLNEALNESNSLDLPTRHFIRRIEEWLSMEQRGSISFLSSLFHLRPSFERIRLCVHNPAYDPQLMNLCRSHLGQNGSSERYNNSSYLEEAVKQSNKTRARMIQLDKYDQYQMNPLFGAKHCNKRKLEAPEYYGRGRKVVRRQKPAEVRSEGELFALHYPLHKAALDGDAVKTKMLLAQGWDPNQKDQDTWTPLHYAAFYNKIDVCVELLHHSSIDVNIQNKTGITALHFAALNAHEYIVELILSHAKVQADMTDFTGRTAYDLCSNMPKKEWQDVAMLLKQHMEPLPKIEVHLSNGTTLQVKVESISDATAGEVKEQIFKEMNLPESAKAVFAIWMISSRLSLQLNDKQKIKRIEHDWEEHMKKWGEDPMGPSYGEKELVRVVFQRHSVTTLEDEKLAVRESIAQSVEKQKSGKSHDNQENTVVTLLFEESQRNFLRGMLPCGDRDSLCMAAIIFLHVYGHERIDENVLPKILPSHLIPQEKKKRASTIKSIQKEVEYLLQENKGGQMGLERRFLEICWSKNVYGCTTFRATMYMNRPVLGVTEVYVGLNDWGLIVINSRKFSITSGIMLRHVHAEYDQKQREQRSRDATNEMPTSHIEIRGKDPNNTEYSFSLATKQAQLINNLLKQLKNKKGITS